ncbi:Alpha/beta hydrolase [Frankia sp. AiPs1]|uniref:alpha/beta hydrolase n=1 Tax=Frankia sp. AiPa1 TaxID=573492 RepID=UPI00202B51F9|nr:alpha/beta hydrolase [Frankia sp. AiPa1]MCL9760195.1 alpha/beta hydrolase [Frankia sp. AiPa1]
MTPTLDTATNDLDIMIVRDRAQRAALADAGSLPVAGLTITDVLVPGVCEGAPVRVRVYRPDGPSVALPIVVWMHGGAFVLGSVDAVHDQVAGLARRVGAVFVSVGYRLAPEHPFPAGLDDCYRALTWAVEQAAALGADPARLAVAGVSAGATLSAGLALLARDRGGPAILLQGLAMPALDDRLETPSMRESVDTPVWNRPLAVRSWRHYLGEGVLEASPYAAPARVGDLAGLPAAYVTIAGLDPLRDEGILYAHRLMRAGVAVELHTYPDVSHGFRSPVHTGVAQRANQDLVGALRRALVDAG